MALIAGVLLFTIVVLFWLMVIEILLADRRVGIQGHNTSTQSSLTEKEGCDVTLQHASCLVVASGN